MSRAEWHQVINRWRLPEGEILQDRIGQMIRPALYAGFFGGSYTRYVTGLQYHLGGRTDTMELAGLAKITARDHVLDVCCFIGGPALQLVETFKCHVTGVDIAPNCIAAANRIAELAGLAQLATFRVADAGNLPFDDESFSVVWNQGSLENYATWLREFDRVVAKDGRIAITFEIGNNDPATHDHRWRLEDVIRFVENLGYCIEHADDITQRDIEIGWKALDRQLVEHEREFAWLLGEDWVCQAHTEFAGAIAEMQRGEWGNGRIVARKSR
ncbi:MAG: methyltransferase domain-containing protein [Chloroflexi bacterium]|nr:methyltransferase domain-containing protein [Chloroflexota bacterium]